MSSKRQTRAGKAKAPAKSPSVVIESDYEDPTVSPGAPVTPSPSTPKRKRASKSNEASFTVAPLNLAATDSPVPSPSKKPRKALPEHDALSPVHETIADENVFVDQDGSETDAADAKSEGSSNFSDADEPGGSAEHTPAADNDGMTDPVYEHTMLKGKKAVQLTRLPSVCAFSDAKMYDPALVKKRLHKGLPALPNYGLVPYNDPAVQEYDPTTGDVIVPRITLDSLQAGYKSLQKGYLISFLKFTEAGGLGNPSQADPRNFIARQGYCKPDSETWELVRADSLKTMSWMSLAVGSGSQIIHGIRPAFGDSPKKLIYKFVAGIGVQGYADRAEAFFPTCFGHESMRAEILEGSMVYQTRNKRVNAPVDDAPAEASPKASSSKAAPQTPVSKSTSMLGRLQLSNVSAHRPRPMPANPMSGYDFTADVPIYDGRKTKFVPDQILTAVLTLNKWHGEIPNGACFLVVYNAQANRYQDYPWKLTFYIRFAIILAA
ncbi:hypothetical protein BKA70DRAFT_1231584 [Coprinopsis sp. MPI-PUGE-AT-0042]|nr:hypothetical protein BKA70DRAFT_1231584 [Coprinopsis sp. MPI-PUGE-AT-0042]